MKSNFIKVYAILVSCFTICAVTACGNVEKRKDSGKTIVSGNEETTAADTSDVPENSSDKSVPDKTDPTSEDKPVSAEPSENVTMNTSGTNKDSEITDISLTFYETALTVGESKMPIVTMLPENAQNKDELWTSSDETVAIVDAYGNITGVGEGTCTITVSSCDNPDVKADVKVTVETAPEAEVADGVTYIDGILIANKTYALPASYNPGGLTDECSAAFQQLVNGAAADNINIYLSSGFRSYDYQSQIYNNYVAMDGQAKADTYSARPGHSEHQTGLAIDCNIIDDSFIGTPEAIWLENHCHEYGFIIRYPKSKESITGYKYEPWHIRYIGVEKAKSVHDSGLCLEEYLGITSQYNY